MIYAFAQNEYCWYKQEDKCFTGIRKTYSVTRHSVTKIVGIYGMILGKKQTFKLLQHQVQDYKQIKGSTSCSHHCSVWPFPGFGGKNICPVLMTKGYLYMTTVEMLGLGILAINNVLHHACVIVSWRNYKYWFMFQVKVLNSRTSINILIICHGD